MRSSSFLRQAEVVVVKLEPAALLAPVQVQRRDRLSEIGDLSQQEMPAPRRPPDPHRQLAERAEAELADGAGRWLRAVHGISPGIREAISQALYPKRPLCRRVRLRGRHRADVSVRDGIGG